MDKTINLEDPNFTAYVLGELEGLELNQFQAKVSSSSLAQKEIEAMEEMAGLLSDSLKDEWQSNSAEEIDFGSDDAVKITSHALGEFDCEDYAALVADSVDLSADEAGIEEMASLLSGALEAELWANEVMPIEIDSMQFTDFATGELDGFESEKFEKYVASSTVANSELSATEDAISLLSAGLEDEWKTALESDGGFSLVEESSEQNSVVSVDFRKAAAEKRNWKPGVMSLAAALAVSAIVATVTWDLKSGGALAQMENNASPVSGWGNASQSHVTVALAPEVTTEAFTPRIHLTDEVSGPLELALADSNTDSNFSSYLSGSMVNVSLSNSNTTGVDHQRSFLGDSTSHGTEYSVKEGKIGGRLARSVMRSDRRKHENGLESLMVQTMVMMPEGAQLNLDSMFPVGFTHNGNSSVAQEFSNIESELGRIVDTLESPGSVNVDQLKSELSSLLKQHRELGNVLRSK